MKQEVQRNTVAAPPPVTISEPEAIQKPPPEIPAGKEQQPKPPTSPKPKVRKEELKLKEDLAKKEDKPRPQLITKLKGDEINMVAPLKLAEPKETSDKATVKNLNEESEKQPAERFESKLEINHNPVKEKAAEKENNEVTPSTPATPLVKPI